MAGDFQNQFASVCQFAKTGKFGSKFVTVVVSGRKTCNICKVTVLFVPSVSGKYFLQVNN